MCIRDRLHSDVINVAYILELIADLNPDSEDYGEKRQHIIDTMIKDPVMRNKTPVSYTHLGY